MSAYSESTTEFKDAGLLVAALAECGYPTVEVHTEAQHLYGYRGDKRNETANVIVRRKHTGHASNDIGFKLNPVTGTYQAIISAFDADVTFNHDYMARLKCAYAEKGIMRQAARAGLKFTGRKTINGKTQLQFVQLGR